jgi:carbamoyl-phosphate synthase large subunit
MAAIRATLGQPTPDRLLKIAQAMRHGATVEQINRLVPLRTVVPAPDRGDRAHGRRHQRTRACRAILRTCANSRPWASPTSGWRTRGPHGSEGAAHRRKLKVRPVFKRIDTCAAEFASPTAYMYSTYETGLAGDDGNEAKVSDKKKVMILGGGPNRIGQGIEFDYCCCHACFALHDAGYESIMVNCNPETVSTDYDTSDRLYFEPLTAEDTLEIIHAEQQRGKLHGVIVQFGGQTPLKLAGALEEAGVPILGTTPDAIDLAEDRDRFAKLIKKLKLRQPENGIARSGPEAKKIAKKIGFPVVIRPSYVLGGRAMEIVRDDAQLQRYITEAVVVSGDSPVLIDSYLSNATRWTST